MQEAKIRILSEHNRAYDMNALPAITEDLRYCVLDYSNPNGADGVDFIFQPLIFLDVFPRPAADLSIGGYRLQIPLDWSIIIADKNFGNMEILEIKHLNDRPFEAFLFNPISGFMPSFAEITIENIFPDITWNMPKLKFGHILAVPLHDKPAPLCAFFVREISKVSEVLDITKIFT